VSPVPITQKQISELEFRLHLLEKEVQLTQHPLKREQRRTSAGAENALRDVTNSL
jgi:hypothetical protein